MKLHFVIFCFFFVTFLCAAVPPGVWPQWRGDGTGVSTETNLPVKWSAASNVLWKERVPGFGWSNPIVARGRVFLTTAIYEGQEPPLQKGPPAGEEPPQKTIQRLAMCFDANSGKVLWQRTVAETPPTQGNHLSNTWATETPVTDGERVFFMFGNVGVFCFDYEGKPLWQHKLEPLKVFSNWGTASSPVLDGDKLFLVCDNNEQSYVMALDTKTGKQAWREERHERSTWSTPLVWRNTKRTELVVMGSSYIRGYDPKNGRELWRLASENAGGGSRGGGGQPPGKGMSKSNVMLDLKAPPPPRPGGMGKGGSPGSAAGKPKSGGCKASPTATPNLLYVGMSTRKSEGELGPMWAVKPGASGDISLREGETSSKDIAWHREDAGSHFTSPLVYGELLYVFTGQQGHPLNVFDAATGETVYQQPLGSARSNMGSPFAFDGKVACVDSDGTAFVIRAGREFKLLETNEVEAMTWASPALAAGHIYLRTTSTLFCIGK
ncbi:MAG: PQQ-binding-like beta-propeller repeat protein [Verrucomicrobia bacterium]|nr:PQQ-binding-like beta-propeller repeat protein [Verrucomicrobiota bacterium]